ncbi:type III PLP-dependent enzyme [Shimia sp. SDUM112013]|uniref:type III PLP-dependent enzyme n=1 Tax=Shimia sp. SDUM112013 TaxID=3136160 RepID=UPI0032EE379E
MTLQFPQPVPVHRAVSRVDAFIASQNFDRPTLVLDLEQVVSNHAALKRGLGDAQICYAVKANPTPALVARLAAEGCGFDAASRGEIELCLSQGAQPSRISFGNTIKRPSDIAFAYGAGVRLFAADAEEELDKIAENAPGAQVYIRLLVTESEADWPLTRKFGCAPEKAAELMARAQVLGLKPVGISFHVGSQTRQSAMWLRPLQGLARVWNDLRAAGFPLELVNIGGGFPAFYGDEIEETETYAAAVRALVGDLFPGATRVMAEPGRGMVANAGAIAAEVMLVSRKSDSDLCRWVYLDIGRFSGLAETEGEAIRYQIATPRDGGETGPCILAGPSCDSADVLYEKRPMALPLDLAAGDKVIIRNTGAYTTSYSSVGFNGFPPLECVVL